MLSTLPPGKGSSSFGKDFETDCKDPTRVASAFIMPNRDMVKASRYSIASSALVKSSVLFC